MNMLSVLFFFLIHCISNVYSKLNRNYLQYPQSVPRVGNITNIELHVKPFNVTVVNGFNKPIANLTIRALNYNGTTQYIGPTIHAHPGDLINVTLINDLEGVGRMSQIDKYLNVSLTEKNYQSYKDPDVTNIHVHGLHVDPNIDDISLYVSPKCSKLINQTYWNHLDCYVNQSVTPHVVNTQNYPYRIPYDHYPGTHWYHAHRHGSVTFDIMSGIYGLFIVDDIDYTPPMIDVELLISFTWLHGGDFCRDRINKEVTRKIGSPCIGTGKDNRPRNINGDATYPFNFPIQSACFLNCRMQHEIKTSFTLSDGTQWTQLNASSIGIYPVDLDSNIPSGDGGIDGKQYFIVNGQIQPYIKINPSKWYHFRIVNTVMNYLLFWVANDTTATNCNFDVMGQDGIYFRNGTRNLFSSPYIDRKVIIPPGSRADLAVRCRCNTQHVQAIDGICDYEIYASSKFKMSEIDKFVPLPLRDILLFTLEVPVSNISNHAIWTAQPYSTTPYLFDTLKTATNSFCAPADYTNMTQCNVVQGRERYPAGKPKFQSLEAINQFTFNSSNYLAKICSDNTHEWLITNNFHPIHQHTFPFQLQENITNGWIAMVGDWRDTVGGTGTFRIKSNFFTKDFQQFTHGALIMHCHYVPHEDHGMMAQFELIHNCSSIKGKYIVPIANESNVITTNASPTIKDCIQRNATAIVYLQDVNCYMNIQLIIYNNCYFEFVFSMKPRSETIGNVWIGLGVSGNQTRFNLSNPIRANMTGDALIMSILATHSKPLSKLTTEEVHLDYHRRTSVVYENNYFECGQFNGNNYILSWKCRRPFCLECNEKLGPSWMTLNEGDTSFALSYGEGQFRSSVTYHSSSGSCAFSFGNVVHCNISQNIIDYRIKY